jgi:hypothetical protein
MCILKSSESTEIWPPGNTMTSQVSLDYEVKHTPA